MRKLIVAFLLIATLSAVLGVGYAEYATTSSHPDSYPTELPTLEGTTAISTGNGVLKCKGKVVKVEKAALRGELAAHPDVAVDSPQIVGFGCAKNKDGKENGNVKVTKQKKDGTLTVEEIPASE